MCGIAGIIGGRGDPVSPVRLKSMTEAIAHRGPDGEGHFIDRELGLGHRRLAIIDLTPAASQPMATTDDRYVITYNGELYNFRELRVELKSRGHQFRSHSDTEVVLAAFAEWGKDSLTRLNGMFAFAIWDRAERRLFLARDRFGVKPLYWVQAGGAFLFASEIKALSASGYYQPKINLEGLVEYLTFQNFFSERTLYADVQLLPAGSYLEVCPDTIDACLTPQRYWDFEFVEPVAPEDEADYCDALEYHFRKAVKRQLVSDVDVGAYLSGGMDSGAVVSIAAQEIAGIKSFTCGFDLHSASGIELSYDERSAAEYMSYLFKTEHYEMVLKAGDMERVMPRLVRHLEEPRVGQCYPNFYAAQLASRFVKVVLSGGGGDEIFAGYPWRYYRAVVNNDFPHYVSKYYQFWQRLIPECDLPRVFAPVWDDVKHISPFEIFKDVFPPQTGEIRRPEDYVNNSLYFEAKTFLNGLLVVEDKLSMAHGLETRLPFLDNDVVDLATRIPVGQKLGNLTEVIRVNENEPGPKTRTYFEKTRDGKLVLRKAMSRIVPNDVAERIKRGFSAPDASWFRGESIDYVRRVLFGKHARIFDILDAEPVRALVRDHLEGRENRRLLVWSLLYLEEWLQQNS